MTHNCSFGFGGIVFSLGIFGHFWHILCEPGRDFSVQSKQKSMGEPVWIPGSAKAS